MLGGPLLSALERFFLKGLELESHGEHRVGVSQELARGFGVEEYKSLLAGAKANEARLKTAGEFGNKEMGDAGFGATLVRHALFAVCKTMETDSPRDGLTWLTTEIKDYASGRARILEILEFLQTLSGESQRLRLNIHQTVSDEFLGVVKPVGDFAETAGLDLPSIPATVSRKSTIRKPVPLSPGLRDVATFVTFGVP